MVLPLAALTDKDRADLVFALDQHVDWIALSFVQRPEDVAEARRLIAGRAALLAKIEKPAAVERLDGILELADAVMVARGDLGVELPPQAVPPLQKMIVEAARRMGRPVVVATQMLESMISSPSPTRAEVSDVATAVYDGADAVMLSAESASGQYPCEAVTMMNSIATSVEADPSHAERVHFTQTLPDPTTADAIAQAANTMVGTVGAAAIVCFTSSGSTARRLSRERPAVPLMVLTPSLRTARKLGILWGAHGGQDPRHRQFRGDDRQGQENGAAPRRRQGRRPDHHHRRSAVRDPGIDQRHPYRPAGRGRARAAPEGGGEAALRSVIPAKAGTCGCENPAERLFTLRSRLPAGMTLSHPGSRSKAIVVRRSSVWNGTVPCHM